MNRLAYSWRLEEKIKVNLSILIFGDVTWNTANEGDDKQGCCKKCCFQHYYNHAKVSCFFLIQLIGFNPSSEWWWWCPLSVFPNIWLHKISLKIEWTLITIQLIQLIGMKKSFWSKPLSTIGLLYWLPRLVSPFLMIKMMFYFLETNSLIVVSLSIIKLILVT